MPTHPAARFSWIALILPLLASTPVLAQKRHDPANVILITWDGVRWEEMFEGENEELGGIPGREIFDALKARVAGDATLLGDRVVSDCNISNPTGVSLPGYQSLMAGLTTSCGGNGCGRIKHETLPEGFLRVTGLPIQNAAIFGSWDKIAYAAERTEGSAVVNTGITAMLRPETQQPDETMSQINAQQKSQKPPWGDARFDRFTWRQAMHYLGEYRPAFTFISLNDSDEWAHRNDYSNYLRTLRQYDLWLEELLRELPSMGAFGQNTIVLVTTDHSRGKGKKWTDHGANANSKRIWMFAQDVSGKNRISEFASRKRVDHNDVRGLIEGWLGVEPEASEPSTEPSTEPSESDSNPGEPDSKWESKTGAEVVPSQH